ncbi:MAG: branched-chain amino acid ABC transporter permease [Candidatus Bathyarchaeia archaeon]
MQESRELSVGKGATKRYVWFFFLLVGCGLLPLVVKVSYVLHVINVAFLYIIATVSFRFVMMSGQFPLAHGAFMAIGAYVSGCMAKWLRVPPALSIVISIVVAAFIAAGVALPFSRLRAVYYAMVSLFFSMLVVYAIQGFPTITGGEAGLIGIPPLIGVSKLPYYYLFLVITLLSLAILYRFEVSRVGINLKSIAQSPQVAASLGIDIVKHRVFALAIGSLFAALAGALYAHYQLVTSPKLFGLMSTFMMVLYVAVGGMHSFWGPILGVLVLKVIPELARVAGPYVPYVSGGMMLAIAYARKGGLYGLMEYSWRKIKDKSKGVGRDVATS